MSIISRFEESRMGQFWLKYDKKIVLTIGIVLIAATSFEAGYLHGQKNKQEPVIVNKVSCAPCLKNENTNSNSASNTSNAQNNSAKIENKNLSDNQKCAFVASKNSNKFHLPTCQFAQKIKPENKICFSSKEDAIERGYQGAKCCIK